METNNRHNNRSNQNGVGFALLLIVFGVVFYLFNIDIIPRQYKSLLISWQMVLIVIGLFSLFRKNYAVAGTLIAIGSIFIYPKLCRLLPDFFFCFDMNLHTNWPLVLVLVGVILIIGRASNSKRKTNYKDDARQDYTYDYNTSEQGNTMNQSASDYIDKKILFSSSEQILLSQNFKGGEGSVVFGELIVDLRRTKLAPNTNTLDIQVMFASAIIYAPSDWVIEVKSNIMFGSFEDKRFSPHPPQQAEATASKMVVRVTVIFGSGEIRS